MQPAPSRSSRRLRLPVKAPLFVFLVCFFAGLCPLQQAAGEPAIRVRPAHATVRSSGTWRKLRKSFLKLLAEEAKRREWVPVETLEELDEDSPYVISVAPQQSLKFRGFSRDRDRIADEQVFRDLGKQLPQGFNAAFGLKKAANGLLTCAHAPWLAVAVIDAVREATTRQHVKYYLADVRYLRGGSEDDGDETEAGARDAPLPTTLPLTPNNKVFTEGAPDLEPQTGSRASILCTQDGQPPQFIPEDTEDEDVTEQQPGPWGVTVVVRSRVNPLAAFGRSYELEVLDNVAVTVPAQPRIPLPLSVVASLDTLLQLELAAAAAAAAEAADAAGSGAADTAALRAQALCRLERPAAYRSAAKLDCSMWQTKPQKSKASAHKQLMKALAPFVGLSVSNHLLGPRRNAATFEGLVGVDASAAGSPPPALLNLQSDFGAPAASAAERAVLSRLSHEALWDYAADAGDLNSPFSFHGSPDALQVSVDVGKLSSRDQAQLKHRVSGGADPSVFEFKLSAPRGSDAFSDSSQQEYAPGAVRSIYQATVAEPQRQSHNSLVKNLAWLAGFVALYAGGSKLWSWWKNDKAAKQQLKHIEDARRKQEFELKYFVRRAQAADVLNAARQDDMML
ncbi:hypothetical protein BESB_078590 [Besnoitia besnoiti]|uniref:Transmembrane protein n=1 Tax=Besnoitia besnoiti TaxID=94643 RepID=A0A2A9MD83_BESBE|nr:hypothetical protein BESB_078590 [Besnoitia besnoiti]PFH33643.1 hypothetical protein BESB_078590 [Besnoitia besnoiti]